MALKCLAEFNGVFFFIKKLTMCFKKEQHFAVQVAQTVSTKLLTQSRFPSNWVIFGRGYDEIEIKQKSRKIEPKTMHHVLLIETLSSNLAEWLLIKNEKLQYYDQNYKNWFKS